MNSTEIHGRSVQLGAMTARIELRARSLAHSHYYLHLDECEYKLYERCDAIILQILIDAYPHPVRYDVFPYDHWPNHGKMSTEPRRGSLNASVSKLRVALRELKIPFEVYNVHNFGYLLFESIGN